MAATLAAMKMGIMIMTVTITVNVIVDEDDTFDNDNDNDDTNDNNNDNDVDSDEERLTKDDIKMNTSLSPPISVLHFFFQMLFEELAYSLLQWSSLA